MHCPLSIRFAHYDVNGNGVLSLAEVDKGLNETLGLASIFDCKPVVMRAFQAARDGNKKNRKKGQKATRGKDSQIQKDGRPTAEPSNPRPDAVRLPVNDTIYTRGCRRLCRAG